MYSAAPQMPEGRRPVWIQSRFMDAMSLTAVWFTSRASSRGKPSSSVKRWM